MFGICRHPESLLAVWQCWHSHHILGLQIRHGVSPTHLVNVGKRYRSPYQVCKVIFFVLHSTPRALSFAIRTSSNRNHLIFNYNCHKYSFLALWDQGQYYAEQFGRNSAYHVEFNRYESE